MTKKSPLKISNN